MKIPVHMMAFGDKNSYRTRIVDIPDNEFEKAEDVNQGLELVFKYGQNDFQPQDIHSVSVGDVVEYFRHRYWMVMGTGWKKLTKREFDALTPPTSDVGYGFRK